MPSNLLIGLTKYTLSTRQIGKKDDVFEEFPGLIHTRGKDFEDYLAGVVDKKVNIHSNSILIDQERSPSSLHS